MQRMLSVGQQRLNRPTRNGVMRSDHAQWHGGLATHAASRPPADRRAPSGSSRRRPRPEQSSPQLERPAGEAAGGDALQVLVQRNNLLAVYKRSDVDVSVSSGGRGGRRGSSTLIEAAAEHLRRSDASAGAASVAPITELERAFSGVVLLSCGQQQPARARTSEWSAQFEADYVAVVEGAPDEASLRTGLAAAGLGLPGSKVTRVRVVETRPSATFGRLSLIEAAVGPPCAGFPLCRVLADLGHPVVGAVLPRSAGSAAAVPTPAAAPPAPARSGAGVGGAGAAGERLVRSVEGGAHLALIRLRFPSELEGESPAAAGSTGSEDIVEAAVEVPKKFLKLLRREELAHGRRVEAEARASGAAFEPRTIRFAGVDITVTNGLLVPRPSTEVMVDAVVSAVESWQPLPAPTAGKGPVSTAGAAARRVLDLGTGSGCILIAAMARLGPECIGCGVDIDVDALAAAQRNAAAALGDGSVAATSTSTDADKSLLESTTARVVFLKADFAGLATADVRRRLHPRGYHVIVSNPPYLSSAAAEGRHTEEGDRALVAGPSGLEAYESICRAVATASPPLLAPGGRLLFQLPGGEKALEKVSRVVSAAGLVVLGCENDLRGLPRCLVAGMKES